MRILFFFYLMFFLCCTLVANLPLWPWFFILCLTNCCHYSAVPSLGSTLVRGPVEGRNIRAALEVYEESSKVSLLWEWARKKTSITACVWLDFIHLLNHRSIITANTLHVNISAKTKFGREGVGYYPFATTKVKNKWKGDIQSVTLSEILGRVLAVLGFSGNTTCLFLWMEFLSYESALLHFTLSNISHHHSSWSCIYCVLFILMQINFF